MLQNCWDVRFGGPLENKITKVDLTSSAIGAERFADRISHLGVALHVPRSHEREQHVRALPAKREEVQLHDAKVVPRADLSVLETADGEDSRSKGDDLASHRRPGEARILLRSGDVPSDRLPTANSHFARNKRENARRKIYIKKIQSRFYIKYPIETKIVFF